MGFQVKLVRDMGEIRAELPQSMVEAGNQKFFKNLQGKS